jgi:V8-like Glu-specific endopeptidase
MPPTTTLELTGPQFKPLSQALRETLSVNQFDQMLKERLNIDRANIAFGENYTDRVFEVIGEANRAGWVYRLIDAARQERPTNPVFVEYARIVGIAPRSMPNKAELESIIKKANAQLDIATFLARLGAIEGQVCRIDLAGEGEGTGFLVGPSTVLTNYHVIESLITQEHSLPELKCRFDFKVRADGTSVNKGTICNVEELITYSPYDPADLTKDGQQPNTNNLDYALLRLEGEPGNDPIGGKATGESRAWMSMPQEAHSFTANSPLFIVQHPDRKPMKLALDTEAVIGLNGNGTRVEYTTNTEPGSSGSPCFDQKWNLVALHHSGDPNWAPTWNEGIPITLIHEHIQKGGFGSSIG